MDINMAQAHLSKMVNTMVVDNLATHGARSPKPWH